jgi:Tol biopolymer transport system component
MRAEVAMKPSNRNRTAKFFGTPLFYLFFFLAANSLIPCDGYAQENYTVTIGENKFITLSNNSIEAEASSSVGPYDSNIEDQAAGIQFSVMQSPEGLTSADATISVTLTYDLLVDFNVVPPSEGGGGSADAWVYVWIAGYKIPVASIVVLHNSSTQDPPSITTTITQRLSAAPLFENLVAGQSYEVKVDAYSHAQVYVGNYATAYAKATLNEVVIIFDLKPPIIAEMPDQSILPGIYYASSTPKLIQGDGPITWSLVSGPTGMGIDSSSGVVSWPSPTINGSPFTVTIRAENSFGYDEESWLLTFNNGEPPEIADISDDRADPAECYIGPTPILLKGTPPITWSLVSGPTGMGIDSSTGVVNWPNPTISGSPFTVTIRAENSFGFDEESWLLTAGVTPEIAEIFGHSASQLEPYIGPSPNLIKGTPPITWSLVSGPTGMGIDSSTGVVSWPSPTINGSPFTVTIHAANWVGFDEESWILTVSGDYVPSGHPPLIVAVPDQSTVVGKFYSTTPSLVHGTPPVSWTLVAGPPGMAINSATGKVIWPFPMAAGSPFKIIIRAQNSYGEDQESWLLTVNPATGDPPEIEDIPDHSVNKATPYTSPTPALIKGTPPITWSLVSGPTGMGIDSSTGVVTWPNPVATGSPFNITIRASNSAGADTEPWLLTVISNDPIITSIVPSASTGTSQITIYGNRFGATQGSGVVTFWWEEGQASAVVSTWSNTIIDCKVPANAQTGCVTVTTAEGVSNCFPFIILQNARGKLAYVSPKDGESDIWVMQIDPYGATGPASNLTADHSGNVSGPKWSPDGKKIVFSSPNSGTDQIWVMNADGTQKTMLTNMSGYYCRHPSFSPDQTKVAFYRHYGTNTCEAYGTAEVCVMNSNSSNVVCFGNTDGHGEYNPGWSPDGTKLIYDRDEGTCNNAKDIWTMNADGTGKALLYPPLGQNNDGNYQMNAVWATNGKILFTYKSDFEGIKAVMVINSDGSGGESIISGNYPEWYPTGESWAFSNSRIIYTDKYEGLQQTSMADFDGNYWYLPYDPAGTSSAHFIQATNYAADLDFDIDVDGKDLHKLILEFGRSDCSPQNPCESDYDNDGVVGATDLLTFSDEFGRTYDTDNDSIPEDGDLSGVAGDNPCIGYTTYNCDDNCPDVINPYQEDDDFDGIGDVCE